LNLGLLMFSFLLLAFAGDFIYRIHSKYFPMSRDRFNSVIYSFIGFCKIIVIVFNVVPWAALAIIG
jgi:hypothetical protein